MVLRCWPSGHVVVCQDGSKYHGRLCEPYRKTREGWWLVFLDPGHRHLYLLCDGEFTTRNIIWR